MHDPTYSLFQLLGISFFVFGLGITIGGLIGKSIQRKHDIVSFGPRYLRKRPRP